jgi:diguanylate cyclase (GGDEF)-like protein
MDDESTEKEKENVARRQKKHIKWIWTTAISYAASAFFLALFALAGTIPGWIAPVYAAAATVVSVGAYAVIASGLNLKLRDPSLVMPLVVVGILMQLGVVLEAPQITFPFLANLFTVYSFGMMWLSLRNSLIIWLLSVIGIGVVFYLTRSGVSIHYPTTFEMVLMWLYFSLILGRCLLLSVTANDMRAHLADSRHDLAILLDKVQQLATHDELTGAFNRRYLVERLEIERKRAERSNGSFVVAMIDLDHFKHVNDSFGHGVGDEVLRVLVSAVQDTMRDTDVFGRFGGEEFLMILVDSSIELASKTMNRIRATIASRDWSLLVPDLPITMSVGIADHLNGETIEQLLTRADTALYEAKDAGRNIVVASFCKRSSEPHG